jgi:hypothetical protein
MRQQAQFDGQLKLFLLTHVFRRAASFDGVQGVRALILYVGVGLPPLHRCKPHAATIPFKEKRSLHIVPVHVFGISAAWIEQMTDDVGHGAMLRAWCEGKLRGGGVTVKSVCFLSRSGQRKREKSHRFGGFACELSRQLSLYFQSNGP